MKRSHWTPIIKSHEFNKNHFSEDRRPVAEVKKEF